MTLYNSGRAIVYTNEVPFETDVLRTNIYNMTGDAALAATILGIGVDYQTMVRGFPCIPASPPSLHVVVGSDETPDVIYSLQPLDATDYGVIPANTATSNYQFKQGFNWGQTTLETPAPLVTGNSVIHLVQVAFDTRDVNDVSRPYFNSTDPSTPIFNNNYDTRADLAIIELKQGTEGPSPSPPDPDPGFIGLYYVTVTYGQTTISSGDIAKVSEVEGQPFITESLTQKLSASSVSGTYASKLQVQTQSLISSNDIGTTNAVVANSTPTFTPVPFSTVSVGITHTNTGPSTLNYNGEGAKNIIKLTPYGYVNLDPGDLTNGDNARFIRTSANSWILDNPPSISRVNLQSNALTFAVLGGSANTYTASPAPAYVGYSVNGISIISVFVPGGLTNTGASTINVSGLGSIPIIVAPYGALRGGEIQGGYMYYIALADAEAILLNPTVSPFPTGFFAYSAAASAPAGWLHCDGSPVSRTTYAALYAVIGDTWGAGDGSTTFNLPPSSRRTLVGSGGALTGTLGNTVGSLGGSETHSLTEGENGPHTHNAVTGGILTAGSGTANTTAGGTIGGSGLTTSGNGDPHNIMQPSMVGYLCIKT